MLPELKKMLGDNSIALRLLPTYSPELNPCDFVFAFLKNHLRNNSFEQECFRERLQSALESLTWGHVYSFYSHCIETVLKKGSSHLSSLLADDWSQ